MAAERESGVEGGANFAGTDCEGVDGAGRTVARTGDGAVAWPNTGPTPIIINIPRIVAFHIDLLPAG
jgi:hypothetical protein